MLCWELQVCILFFFFTSCLASRGASIVFMPVMDVVFYSLGSGDYDELARKKD